MSTPVQVPIALLAVVAFNDGEALVLNRPLKLLYHRLGKDFVGVDGPFRSHLMWSGNRGAFAGSELRLAMDDGSVEIVKDHWWAGYPKGFRSIPVSDIAGLQRCYVFSGCEISHEDYAVLRASYTGCVYPYRDYEKVIKYDLDRMRHFRDEQALRGKLAYQVRRGDHLLNKLRAAHHELRAADALADLKQVAYDFNEVLGELGKHCECGEPDCRTTRLRAALAKAEGGAA